MAGMAPATPTAFPEPFNIAEYFLDRPARQHPRRTAVAGVARALTYEELAELANRAGNALLAAGVERGDRVLIVLPDSPEFIAAFFGAAKIGAVAVPVNSMARASDYSHYLTDCGARIAIVHSSILHEFLPASGETPQTQIVIVGEERADTGGVRCLKWTERVEAVSSTLAAAPTSPYDTAFFLYTSGSGGQPKGAVHRHKDMLATSRGFAYGVLGLRAEDVTFSVSKLFFAYGLGNAMYFPFSVGAATLLNPERTKVEPVAEIVARRKPTVFFSIPTFYAAVLREAESGRRMDFSSVRLAVSAGEALPAEIFERFRARFGLEILDGIGSTEMLHMFLSSRQGQARPGSCGFPVPGYEAKIVDDSGEPVTTGDIGNLWVKGESAFSGYWQKDELTARTKRAGDWVVTGDKFTCDAEGYFHYCGRADDMMKVAGMWVSPGEVENALLSHPHVAEGAVVGVTTQEGLTHAVAYVVVRAGGKESAELAQDIREHVKARLVAYKCPREVRFCAELPKTATGKIQRFKLRDSCRERARQE